MSRFEFTETSDAGHTIDQLQYLKKWISCRLYGAKSGTFFNLTKATMKLLSTIKKLSLKD